VDEGVLVVRRTIEPRKGAYSLPGGFVDLNESWQESCAREAYEEAHVRIDPAQVKLVTVASAPDQTIVIVGQAAPLKADELPPFHANGEVDDRRILTKPERLAWPIHTEMAEEYLKSRSAR
jgi:ADP-ribose pyrophosphatase YjhB (NUDIX family)